MYRNYWDYTGTARRELSEMLIQHCRLAYTTNMIEAMFERANNGVIIDPENNIFHCIAFKPLSLDTCGFTDEQLKIIPKQTLQAMYEGRLTEKCFTLRINGDRELFYGYNERLIQRYCRPYEAATIVKVENKIAQRFTESFGFKKLLTFKNAGREQAYNLNIFGMKRDVKNKPWRRDEVQSKDGSPGSKQTDLIIDRRS